MFEKSPHRIGVSGRDGRDERSPSARIPAVRTGSVGDEPRDRSGIVAKGRRSQPVLRRRRGHARMERGASSRRARQRIDRIVEPVGHRARVRLPNASSLTTGITSKFILPTSPARIGGCSNATGLRETRMRTNGVFKILSMWRVMKSFSQSSMRFAASNTRYMAVRW